MITVTPVYYVGETKKDYLKQLINFKIDEKLANDFENILFLPAEILNIKTFKKKIK